MRRLLIVAALLTLPQAVYAQFPSQNVSLPTFVIPASAVNGGGVFSGQLLAPATPTDCSVPGFSFQGDTNTGIGYASAETIAFCSNGAISGLAGSQALVANTFRLDISNQDVVLSRGAANRLDLASGDSFSIVSGGFGVGGPETDAGQITASSTITGLNFAGFQTSLGSNVQTLSSTATNDDPIESVSQGRVATTDATPTTVHTITIPTDFTVTISCYVTARRTGGASGAANDGAGYNIEVVMKNTAGTAIEIAAETVRTIGESTAGFNVTSAASGATELIQVTGAATTNITWHSTCRTWQVNQ